MKLTSNQIARVCERYSLGESGVVLGKEYGVSNVVIYRYLRSNGVPVRTRSETLIGNTNNKIRERVSNESLHRYVRSKKPCDGHCEDCKQERKLDLANISNEFAAKTYTRDINNWVWLCRSCHMKRDGRLERLLKAAHDL